jgi:hypothetical protein
MTLELRPPVTIDKGSQYLGTWLMGTETRHGKGIIVFPEGAVYEGQIKDNRATGFGRHVSATGEIYVGQWLEDAVHGNGILINKEKSRYEGGWKSNKQHG